MLICVFLFLICPVPCFPHVLFSAVCSVSCGIPQAITLPNLFPVSMPVVWFRVLCDVLRKHNRDRAADSLSDKGNLYYYVNRAWLGLFYYVTNYKYLHDGFLAFYFFENR